MKRALVLSLICVLGLGFSSLAASLTGYWDTDVTIDPTQADFSAALTLDSELGVTYTVGDWAFTSITTIDDSGWVGQTFDAAGVLGAFTIGSTLEFDPSIPSFTSWEVVAGVSIAGVSFGADFMLEPGVTYLTLTGSGVAGDVTVDVEVDLGSGLGCDFDFSGVTIDLGFPFCCADVYSELYLSCTGFQYVTFGVKDIAFPTVPWLSLDAEIMFTIDEKTLTLTPVFNPGDFACFTLDIDFAYDYDVEGALEIGAFSITGIGLECEIGGVSFSGHSTWDPENLFLDTYWEYYRIATTDDACCGPFSFDLSIYFLEGGVRLFDVSLIDANMSLQVASQFAFTMGMTIDTEINAFTAWTIGFVITW